MSAVTARQYETSARVLPQGATSIKLCLHEYSDQRFATKRYGVFHRQGGLSQCQKKIYANDASAINLKQDHASPAIPLKSKPPFR